LLRSSPGADARRCSADAIHACLLAGVGTLAGRGRPALLTIREQMYVRTTLLGPSPGADARRCALTSTVGLLVTAVLGPSPGADARRCERIYRAAVVDVRLGPSLGADARRCSEPRRPWLGGGAVGTLAGRGRPALRRTPPAGGCAG